MDLMCVDRNTINLIVTAYFIGFIVSGLTIFALPDRWGCKKTIAVFNSIHITAQFTILFIPNYYVRLVAFLVMGLCQLKNSISYMWLFGLIERKHNSICCGIMNCWDCLALTTITLYFMFVSKDWFPLMFAITVLGTASHLFMMIYAPESPKWLLSKGRHNECIQAINRIALFNRQKVIPEDTEFTVEKALSLNLSAYS